MPTSDDLLPRFRVNPSDGSRGRVADTEIIPVTLLDVVTTFTTAFA